MAHMVETMAYAGELPWHGLGVKVIDDLTPEQMMKKAGVDWEVEKQDLVTTAGSKVKSKQALVRKSDGSVLDVVGKGWNPVQNAEAFNFFEEYVKAGDMQMHTAGSLNDGKMVWALAKTNESFELFNGLNLVRIRVFSISLFDDTKGKFCAKVTMFPLLGLYELSLVSYV